MAKKGNLKRETESLLIPTQNNTIRTMSKQYNTRLDKIADIDYVVIKTKQPITS